MYWGTWSKLTEPKAVGGLGFKDFEVLNVALLAKQFWRLINCPSSLWAKVLKGLYFPNATWEEAVRGLKPSWLWTSLLEGRNLIRDGTQWRVGNGDLINFSEDKWVPGIPGGEVSQLNSNHDEGTKIAHFINSTKGDGMKGSLKSAFRLNN